MAEQGDKIDIDSYVVMLRRGDIDGHGLARLVEEGTLSKSDRRKITRKHAKDEGKVTMVEYVYFYSYVATSHANLSLTDVHMYVSIYVGVVGSIIFAIHVMYPHR